jgi:Fe-Mn family superoxide dismutase
MEIHHGKHHGTYVNNLNAALEKHPTLQPKTVESLLLDIDGVPPDIRTGVRNNGGGHANHSLFWEIMAPDGGGEPTGEIARELRATFGSFDSFKQQFTKAALDRFGSGWAWVIEDAERTTFPRGGTW